MGTFLGGEDFDQQILEYLAKEFKKSDSIDLTSDAIALQRLKEAAEKAKMELSTLVESEINLPYITADSTGPKHLNIKITRSKFEQLVEKLVQRTIEPCKIALKDAGISSSEIEEVILVGGMTRVPIIKKTVKDIFNKEPHT